MTSVTATVRWVPGAVLVLYVVFLAAVLTEYNPTVATDVVSSFARWLAAHGAPATITEPARVEFGLNAAMFVPMTLLVALTFPRHPWANWVVYAFVLSGAVELYQGLYLPPRSAQFVDVVSNTLGGLVGAVLAIPVNYVSNRR